ncbi:MAG: sulfate adenylyltransferase [Thalassolituus sp.]|jgi:predicted transglutaminase-like cysteine proteinase|uniref:transglutaminase-like cysteine peptidase n=1 Tax=Thalassolituus TaxID=187492 RepID=UPI00243F9F56|nr:transglutaminase-like cysteine peptidase [Pseudomonadota bacterium]MEC8102999.1 transglutaminase-like cysteine peptidase [Pseudomonadota bacterium]MEC8524195.1 transglutaminase-like cysteine peptidase [Pseudomonadota bacterium]MEE2749128.1 transglutaminase-like cysteine peptidase [Pseudomonadota bacterium]TNC84522.1 MAG: sulfate adenylyltransferase [Thalassolituus sp.]
MKLRRVTSAISGKLFWSSLLISATLVADVNQWVPEDLTARAEEEYDYSAGRRIDDWRRMMERVANYSEERQLEEVNYFFNRRVPFRNDDQHWGKIDYWATPYEALGTNGGDCEDYVIAKYYTLSKIGVDVSKLRITYVKAVRLNQAHMVLTYFPTPDAIPLVLDNLINQIRPASKRPDLDPVYSFNANGMWLDKMKGQGILLGDPNKLDLWTDLRIRMNNLGMDL